MSFDAIASIAQAEDAAKVAVSYAEAQAKQMAADAEAAGKASIAAAVAKAESEIAELKRRTEQKAQGDAEKLSGSVENRKAVLRAAAEAKLEAAAALVVERIVKG